MTGPLCEEIAEIATIYARLPAEGRDDMLRHAHQWDLIVGLSRAAQSARVGPVESKPAPRGGNVVAFPVRAGGAS